MLQFMKVKLNGLKSEDMLKVIVKITKMERKIQRKRIRKIKTIKTTKTKLEKNMLK